MGDVNSEFSAGPLDYYRKQASFDWRKMKEFIYSKEELNFLKNAHNKIKQYPEFLPPTTALSFDEERYRTYRQSAIARGHPGVLFDEDFFMYYDFAPSTQTRLAMTLTVFNGILGAFGDEDLQEIRKQSEQGKISGCFILTEIGHGTNVKGIRTRATYDKESDEFIIHTPDFEAAKAWGGGLGNAATHALFFAQLYVDGKNHGPHIFLAPIRHPDTLLPYPGVTVGDMGEKIGLNGVDNGFLIFNNYRVPRKYLVNKTGGVTSQGTYSTPFESPSQRFAASLLALSGARVGVIISSETLGGHAVTIAVRYSGVRRQFGPQDEEIPILEYQTQQYRLLPYLASVYVFKVFSRYLKGIFNEHVRIIKQGDIHDYISMLGIEIHVITSAAKPLYTWIMRDAIQSSREACGGHGYLKAAGIGNLRNDQDAALTYEGENWVLNQQTSNFLLKIWPSILEGTTLAFPVNSGDYLNDAINILNTFKFSANNFEELYRLDVILDTFKWLVCYLLKRTYDKRQELLQNGANKFDAGNNIQVFYAKRLSTAYIQHFILKKFEEKILSCLDTSLKTVLERILLLYGLFSLDKYLDVLYQGGFIAGDRPASLIQDGITEMCSRLKNDAVSLVDAIAAPDFVLNSVIGSSDGQVYHHLENALFSSPYGTERPTWWKDIVNWQNIASTPPNSKL
ncbi:peroxisomal acyl-coenzyme A oxidase 3-like [Sitophilus oryzae]|uniref:Acyl-coenzyme A oxidase n=1 Tax=Sitophilus oryzae TaxID=7048 RepID=A0A6J2YJP3_SITOR|nr:peroxisomal acyl-coenzyme A oxidase 3-like [Sitophilus oryzae]